jgi:hypothetical protein
MQGKTWLQRDRSAVARPRRRGIVAVAALASGVAGLPMLAAAAPAAAAATAPKGTIISAATNAFGTSLVVGSGRFAGFTLYFITSDHGKTFGCTCSATRP